MRSRRQITLLHQLIFLVCFTLLLSHGGTLHAQLMVHPTRVVFEKSVRSTQIQLFNRGKEEATFRISVVRMRMDQQGGFQRITEGIDGENFADDLIRFSPRQVSIPAGGSQTVRVQLRKPEGLAPGEYRSHLLFQALPPARDNSRAESEGMSVTLRPIVSITIPLIVLHGDTTATVEIEKARLLLPSDKGQNASVSFDLVRGGTRSIYGDITVSRKGVRGPQAIVGEIKGVAIYNPNIRRSFVLPLTGLPNGDLVIGFRERRERGEAISTMTSVVR